jgi:KH/beta-lactamase-domain protein
MGVDAQITDTGAEGALIIFFTKNRSFLLTCIEMLPDIAKKYKKRIDVRSDSSLLLPPEKAEEKIKSIVPEDAGITSVEFDPGASKVIIEAKKPGLVIGKKSNMVQSIKSETGWTPFVLRTPPLKSDVVTSIRRVLLEESKKRREFLHRLGINITREGKETKWIRLSTLGGFQEVGRSCILLQTPESRVLLDCGVNVASDKEAFPYLEAPEFDVNRLDAVIISHAHLDHSGLVPILYKYGYTGPVYCTAPTADLMALLQLDYIDVVEKEGKKPPYGSVDIKQEILHTITLPYDEVVDISPDVRVALYNAGHILGSSVIHLHVGEGLHNVVYTGDIKFLKTKTLEPAVNIFPRVETLIIEATYGGSNDIQPPLDSATEKMVEIIKKTINRGGKCLVPVLGVGRSQELMLVLEEQVRKGNLEEIPIYLDGMMWDSTAIHTTYPEFLSEEVRNLVFGQDHNPLLSPIFKRVGSQKEREQIVSGGPAVIMATSGMLTGGSSVWYLNQLADSPKNSIAFINYQAEGSLGRRIQKGWKEMKMDMPDRSKQVIKVNLEVHTVGGFSAHSDRKQLMDFITSMNHKPRKVIVGHGEASKCIDLARWIYKEFRTSSVAPENLEVIRLR